LGVKDIYDFINNVTNKTITTREDGLLVLNKEHYKNITLNSNLPDVLFIDEVTHYGAHELYLLQRVAEESLKAGKLIRIIAAGDTSQKGYNFDKVAFNVNYTSGIFAPKLFLTVRALNSQNRKVSDFMSSLAIKTGQIWETEKDDSKVLELVRDGIPLISYRDANTLNGHFLTAEKSIPSEFIETLKNIISKDKSVKIALLNETTELPEDIASLFSSNGITEANYKVYTPANFQGAEGDYFIFRTSFIPKDSTIASKIRDLNTYLSRAKYGTIILNDAAENLPFTLVEKIEDYTQFINPLTPEVIEENKKVRLEALNNLLGTDLKVKYDNFKFDTTTELSKEEEESLTEDDIVGSTTLKDDEEIVATYEALPTIVGQDKYMLHAFYNDLNAQKVTHSDGTVSLQLQDGAFYGLKTDRISQKELDKVIDEYISLKYEILGNKKHSSEFSFNGRVIKADTKGTFVMRKSVFDPVYNSPHAKFYGNSGKLLTSKEVYTNIFYKVKDSKGDFFYIHLLTFPKLSTLAEHIQGGVESSLYKNFVKFLSSPNNEIEVSPNSLEVHTSTRLINHKKAGASRQEFTLDELSTIPGLRFYNPYASEKFSKKPSYIRFPGKGEINAFERFKKIYELVYFKKPISEDTLKELFNKYAGKVASIVTFVKSTNSSGNYQSQLQIIPLKSRARPLREVIRIIEAYKP